MDTPPNQRNTEPLRHSEQVNSPKRAGFIRYLTRILWDHKKKFIFLVLFVGHFPLLSNYNFCLWLGRRETHLQFPTCVLINRFYVFGILVNTDIEEHTVVPILDLKNTFPSVFTIHSEVFYNDRPFISYTRVYRDTLGLNYYVKLRSLVNIVESFNLSPEELKQTKAKELLEAIFKNDKDNYRIIGPIFEKAYADIISKQ